MLTKPDFLEKKIVIVQPKDGDKITFKNDNIVVINGENKIKFQLSCYKLIAVYIVGGLNLTTGLIERSKKFGFSILFYTYSFKLYSHINFSMEGNTLLRKKQYCCNNSNEIAKQIVINKIENQRETIKKLRDKSLSDGIMNLDIQIQKLVTTKMNNYEIMGIEGVAAKVYFNRIFHDIEWNGRQPRVKRDKINLLLDIGYTVLFNYIEGLLNIYGFDIYIKEICIKSFIKENLLYVIL